MNEDMKIGTKIALEGVKEELIKVRAELKRKGCLTVKIIL